MALIDCKTCGGGGVIGFNNSWNRDPQCDDEALCPDCRGDGAFKVPYDFCIHPAKCAGLHSCPRNYACSE